MAFRMSGAVPCWKILLRVTASSRAICDLSTISYATKSFVICNVEKRAMNPENLRMVPSSASIESDASRFR
jgi:hypothetical protein